MNSRRTAEFTSDRSEKRQNPDGHGENDIQGQHPEPRCVRNSIRRLKVDTASLDVANHANVKSVTSPAMLMQQWTPQMLTKLNKDKTSTFKSATMRASYMSINRVDVPQQVAEVARFMAEPNEGAWSVLKRLVRYLVGHGRLVHVISEQRYVTAPRVDTDSDYGGSVLTKKSTMCAHLFRGVNLLKSRKLDAEYAQLECCRVGVLRKRQGGSILLGATA